MSKTAHVRVTTETRDQINAIAKGETQNAVIEQLLTYREKVYQLFKIIDDIDTTSDVAKGDDEWYRAKIAEHVGRRHQVLSDVESDLLYLDFYSRAQDLQLWDPPKKE